MLVTKNYDKWPKSYAYKSTNYKIKGCLFKGIITFKKLPYEEKKTISI